MNGQILVTGGAGYIGSHTCVALLQAGFDVIVLDNLSNSKPEAIRRVQHITEKNLRLIRGDLRNRDSVFDVFTAHNIQGVIHFAGLKAVGESTEKPLDYYQNNVAGTANLLEAMAHNGVKSVVFSSSCTVYGVPETLPVREDSPLFAVSPYGQTKLTIEHMLLDLSKSDPDWRISILRYFNPVGAHSSGVIGEDPMGIPNNLMPYVSQVAVGMREELSVFGGDYPTADGTCVRDYIHVVDLARGHLSALAQLSNQSGVSTYNLGTGKGHSVLELIECFEKTTGQAVPFRMVERRPGDTPVVYADPSLAESELGWRAELSLADICADAWRWQRNNPEGYA